MEFEVLEAIRLQLYIQVQKGFDWVGILCVVVYAQRACPSLSCQSRLNFATTLLNRLQRVLLKASANPFAGALYIEDLC